MNTNPETIRQPYLTADEMKRLEQAIALAEALSKYSGVCMKALEVALTYQATKGEMGGLMITRLFSDHGSVPLSRVAVWREVLAYIQQHELVNDEPALP